jgi:hypothetical protein
MLVFCYHNGALGHATMALIETCTKEGNREFPSFLDQQNLHHYTPQGVLFQLKHPVCDVSAEQSTGNLVACSTSATSFGRYLILLMGLKKWIGEVPDHNDPVIYKQLGQTYGEQLEILSVTLKDKIQSEADWYVGCDHQLDIVDYWQNPAHVSAWLGHLGFNPIPERVEKFCECVSSSNQSYYDSVAKCQEIVNDVVLKKAREIDLSFYETAMCHSMLLRHHNVSHIDLKLLHAPPTNTSHLIEILPKHKEITLVNSKVENGNIKVVSPTKDSTIQTY